VAELLQLDRAIKHCQLVFAIVFLALQFEDLWKHAGGKTQQAAEWGHHHQHPPNDLKWMAALVASGA
jgi:hypothetical protein